MNPALMGAALLALSGMLSLCLGLERHYKQLLASQPRQATLRILRGLGWLALAASFGGCVVNWGWAMGPVGWFGLISMAGFALVMWAPYAIRSLIAAAGIGWLLLGLLTLLR